jgi:hypothetical protein
LRGGQLSLLSPAGVKLSRSGDGDGMDITAPPNPAGQESRTLTIIVVERMSVFHVIVMPSQRTSGFQ